MDVFLAGIAGRSFTDDYDDFFRPLSGPLGFSTNVNLAAFPEEIGAVSRDTGVAALEPLMTARGSPQD